MVKIGVLALQGAFREHELMLRTVGAEAVAVRLPPQLDDLDGLIIPGGESTTIGKLATQFGLMAPLREFVQHKPVWGTCAGLIFLAKDGATGQPLLNAMDISVARNAFGRQVDSFETLLTVAPLGAPPFPAVFIRAPAIQRVGAGVQVLAQLENGVIVAVRQNHLLGTAFHPELTGDSRFHKYFLQMVAE